MKANNDNTNTKFRANTRNYKRILKYLAYHIFDQMHEDVLMHDVEKGTMAFCISEEL
jgi:hypothetical protein